MKHSFHYVSYIRFPSEKAHSLYIAKQSESFLQKGHSVKVVSPRRFGILTTAPEQLYQLKERIPVHRVPSIDLFPVSIAKKCAYYIGVFSFAVSVTWYALLHIHRRSYIVTPDIAIAYVFTRIGYTVVLEVHDYPNKKSRFQSYVLKGVAYIQTNNHQKKEKLIDDFHIAAEKIYAVHNGITLSDFDIHLSQKEAREYLRLDTEKKYAVYTGHLYGWKGVDTVAEAAVHMPEVTVLFVGGTDGDVARMKKKYAHIHNIQFLGHRQHTEVPQYLKAADVLLLPNTAKDERSCLHTSPMKLFEYMASKRPIVASNIPSIREVLNEENAVLIHPDDPKELADAVKNVLRQLPTDKVQRAFADVSSYTWSKRADKIIQNLEKTTE